MKRPFKLHHFILAGILLGVLAGWAAGGLPEGPLRSFLYELFSTLGEIFLRLLKAVMIPLIVASLIVGMLNVGDPRKLGRIGAKTITYYLCTTVIAITIALVLVNLIRPGKSVGPETRAKLEAEYGEARTKGLARVEEIRKQFTVWSFLKSLIPRNPIKSMVANPPEMLQIIVFAIMVGFAAAVLPEMSRRPFSEFMGSLNDVMLKLVGLIMYTAPVGAFALIAKTVLQTGVGILWTLMAYVLTVIGALAIHFFVTYSLVVRFGAGMSPFRFWAAIREAMLTGFSTSSSAATLAVNIKCVRENLGVSAPVAGFCLPLGATINMDGTSIMQGVASVFIAQVYMGDLSLGVQLSILVMVVLASIGTAPVPGAGIIMLAVVMLPLGIPLEGIALILGVDRILDMIRTTVNITGDAAGAVLIAASEGEQLEVPAPGA